MFFVYILRSLRDKKRYVGFTQNLERRMSEHERGIVKSTRKRGSLELIYFEEFGTKEEARNREKFFKTGGGREYLSGRNIK